MNTSSANTLHPLFWIAGISVTLLSLVGIASLTGVLPSKSEPPAIVAAPASAPEATPPATPATPAEAVKTVSQAAPATPAPARKVAARHKAAPPVAALPPAAGAGIPPDYVAPQAIPACTDCGVISNIREMTREGEGSGLGALAGGLLGGAVANNIGAGNGRTLATIAGAVGGGLLGNKLEKDQRKERLYQVSVRLEDGSTQIIDVASLPPWRIGDAVKIVHGSIVSR